MPTLAETANGPVWVVWLTGGLLFVVSIVLLSGKGSFLIAGYNTAPAEEKAKYDEKKLCRIMGAGLLLVSIIIVVMGLFAEVLPESTAYIGGGIILLDVIVMLVLANTVCKKS